MKHLLFITLALVFAIQSQGSEKLGSECGLTDTNEESSWKVFGNSLAFDMGDKEKILKLRSLTKQQIIITAKYFVAQNGLDITIRNTLDAAKFLSEADGFNVTNYNVNGKRVTEVTYYPGENPYGVIFQYTSSHILGYSEDGTVYCK